jgi:hypothetical protein
MDKALLIYLESDLKGRYSFFESISNIECVTLNLKNKLCLSPFETIKNRLSYKKILDEEYNLLKTKLIGIEKIILSNSEGFIAKNIISYIKRDFPKIKLITFQHGIFVLRTDIFIKSIVKKCLNLLSKLVFGFYVIGDGSVSKKTDEYVVCNSVYRDFLLINKWKKNEIIISSYFLKGEREITKSILPKEKKVIFFLQCLSKLGLATKEDELLIIKNIIETLSKKYEKIEIKQHPYATIELPILPKNVNEIDEVTAIEEISMVISFFSAALLDYEKYGIPAVSIKSSSILVDSAVHDQFKYFVNFDSFDSKRDQLIIEENPIRANSEVFYQSGEQNIEVL